MTLGHAQVLAMSVGFSGELSYELHIPNEQLYLVWTLLDSAGKAFNLTKLGLYATESMRLEKGYLHWKADIIDEFNPIEAGLDRFVNLNKEGFVGKQALLATIEKGCGHTLCIFEVMTDVEPAHGGDSVFHDGVQVGVVTSGGYGHRINKNLAYAHIKADVAKAVDDFTIQIIGTNCQAQKVDQCLYDPQNLKPRSKEEEVLRG